MKEEKIMMNEAADCKSCEQHDLDLVVKFDDCMVVLSKKINHDTKCLTIEGKSHELLFAVSQLTSLKKAVTIIYKLVPKEKKLIVRDVLITTATGDGLVFQLNEKQVSITDTSFMGFVKEISNPIDKTIISLGAKFQDIIQTLSYNSHLDRLGFSDIFIELRHHYEENNFSEFKRSYQYVEHNGRIGTRNCIDCYQVIKYYYHYSTPQMYAIAERLIKLGMESDIEKYNPVISGKPIPNVSSISVSKASMDIIQSFKGNNIEDSDVDLITFFREIEENPKIGINGIKMINEMLDLYNDISMPHYYGLSNFFLGRYKTLTVFKEFDKITKQFDITVKTLITRIIKASFYENLDPLEYFGLIDDYVRISNMLGLKVPKKMPKDIVRDHDLVSAQYKYVKNTIIESKFNDEVKKNELLLKSVPVNTHYTIISPKFPNDLIEEGLRMCYCVGTYIERYAAGSSKIFFVREKANSSESFVTIELSTNNKLVQASALANSRPKQEVLDFINEWIETLE